jgi:hypothetical protein
MGGKMRPQSYEFGYDYQLRAGVIPAEKLPSNSPGFIRRHQTETLREYS